MITSPETKIKQIRELKNFTQEHIATELGLSIRAYSKIESGEGFFMWLINKVFYFDQNEF
jgi:transcriptional regulator with XRE-family HTH domain